ncbi:MAG TPA: AbiV family abortive infection protein [Streptosporangiaceae bacterium]|nr:AbiV family abortive infection protein [Streptosporangiaceae bacterium]
MVACTLAAARNVLGLLRAAELLAAAGARPRACALAAFAVEECGKTSCLTALAVLPRSLRTQVPVARMLQ